MFGVSIVRRRYLDDVGCDKVDAFKPADDGAEFAGRPAACLGSSCCRSDYDERLRVSMSEEGKGVSRKVGKTNRLGRECQYQ